MNEIATIICCAKESAYYYSKRNENLLHDVIDDIFNDLRTKFLKIYRKDKQPGEKIRLYALVSMTHIEAYQSLFGNLNSNLFSNWNRYVSDPQSWYWKAVDIIASTLYEAIDTGEIKEVNGMKVATLYLNSILMLMSHRILSSKPELVVDDLNDLLDLYFDGLATNDNTIDYAAIL